jgi:hypothetical protein
MSLLLIKSKNMKNHKNKTYITEYSTTTGSEWLRRGHAFVGQTQERLKDILKELIPKIRTMTNKEVERDLKKGLKATENITSELSRFVRQGIEQKRTFKGLPGTLIETRNSALIKAILEIIEESKKKSSLLCPIAKEILRELQRIQAIIPIKELKQMETSLMDIQYWRLTRHLRI